MVLGRQQQRRDTAANWSSNNPTLAAGEIGLDTTNRLVKVGDGSTAWNSLSSFGVIELGHVSDTTLSRASAGVLAVEGVNVLLNGGALGTPSSGTATNLTGFPTLNQNTTGSAATLTTPRAINGVNFDGSAAITIPIPADFMLVQVGNVARAVGSGDFAVGHRVGRAFTATSVIYQFDTADASGSTTVELRRNGTQVTSSSVAVTAANQADGTGTDAARTVTISQSFSAGDRINLQITAVGTTPGKGLRAWLVGTWN